MFTNFQTGCIGRNWLEITPNILRRFRLQVEAVVLTESTREKDIDDRSAEGLPRNVVTSAARSALR